MQEPKLHLSNSLGQNWRRPKVQISIWNASCERSLHRLAGDLPRVLRHTNLRKARRAVFRSNRREPDSAWAAQHRLSASMESREGCDRWTHDLPLSNGI